jgi:hypothetical protein
MEDDYPTPATERAGQAYLGSPKELRQRTVRQQIDMQITELEFRVKELNKLKDLLDKVPDVEAILNQTRKLGF